MSTRIESDGGEYYLTGQKTWVSYVTHSEAAVVWTKFPDDRIGSVLVDLDADGVEIDEHFQNMAGQHQTHFFMDDVRIPEENVLAEGKSAFKEQLNALNWERCGASTFSNAIARCALDQALSHVRNREQFGKPLSEFQGVRWNVARMENKLEASRSLTYRAMLSGVGERRFPERLATCNAKLFSSEIVEEVVSDSLQMFGAAGYLRDHPLEYLYRLQRGRRIAGGTDEMMLEQISNVILDGGLDSLV